MHAPPFMYIGYSVEIKQTNKFKALEMSKNLLFKKYGKRMTVLTSEKLAIKIFVSNFRLLKTNFFILWVP